MKLHLRTSDDFKVCVMEPFRSNFKNVIAEVVDGTCGYSYMYNALLLKDNLSTTKGSIEVRIGYYNVGDVIEVSGEIMNNNPMRTKAFFELRYTDDKNYTELDYTNDVIVSSSKTDEFEFISFEHTVRRSGYYVLYAGVKTNQTGDFYLRNIAVTYQQAPQLQKVIPTRRMYNLRGSANGIALSDNGNHSNDSCSIIEDSATNLIEIIHDEPFTHRLHGIAQAGVSSVSPGRYIAKTRSETKNGFKIAIFDTTTGNLVPLSTFRTNTSMWINVVHHGYDWEHLVPIKYV